MRLDLNVASRPPVPRAARGVATGAAAISAALLAIAMSAVAHSRARLAEESASLPPAVVEPVSTPVPAEIEALALVLGKRGPAWTAAFAEIERSLPAGTRLDRVEWSDGVWTVRVVARDEAELRKVEAALASLGSAKPVTQAWRDDGVVADYRIGGGGA